MAQLGPALYLGVFGPRAETVKVIYDKAFLAHEQLVELAVCSSIGVMIDHSVL